MIKYLLYFTILTIMFCNLFGGCGSCPGDFRQVIEPAKTDIVSNTFINSLPSDGLINGIVIASCGKCNLRTREKGCSLSIKVGKKVYPVEGTTIHDHGDAHSSEGFCNTMRVAWVKGKIDKKTFYSEYFKLVGI